MGVKSTPPLAIKVAIYQRLLAGHLAREVGRSYALSQPTVMKYANDAVAELRMHDAVEGSKHLVGFLSRSVKVQCFQYHDDDIVRELMAPILTPYLAQAEKINFAERESADQHMSTRVSRSTADDFQLIVAGLAMGERPGLTSSGLMRELIEEFVLKHKAPSAELSPAAQKDETPAAPPAPALDGRALYDDLLDSIRSQLEKHGLEPPDAAD